MIINEIPSVIRKEMQSYLSMYQQGLLTRQQLEESAKEFEQKGVMVKAYKSLFNYYKPEKKEEVK